MLRTTVELAPVFLAFIAAIVVSVRFSELTGGDTLRKMFVSSLILQTIILIVAQTSWYTTAVIMGKIEDTWIANYIWTGFNTLTMLNIIAFGILYSRETPTKTQQ